MLHVFSNVRILDFVQIYKIMYVGCQNGIGIWNRNFLFLENGLLRSLTL